MAESHDLAEAIYKETRTFPKEELYGITTQLRRAAISIPSNVAEGQGRRSTGEFRQFPGHALGSLLEVETRLLMAARLDYLTRAKTEAPLSQTAEVGRILNGLINSLRDTHREKFDE